LVGNVAVLNLGWVPYSEINYHLIVEYQMQDLKAMLQDIKTRITESLERL